MTPSTPLQGDINARLVLNGIDKKPLYDLSIAEAGRALRSDSVNSVTLTEHALARVAALDDKLDAFILLTPERALADAARADADLARGFEAAGRVVLLAEAYAIRQQDLKTRPLANGRYTYQRNGRSGSSSSVRICRTPPCRTQRTPIISRQTGTNGDRRPGRPVDAPRALCVSATWDAACDGR